MLRKANLILPLSLLALFSSCSTQNQPTPTGELQSASPKLPFIFLLTADKSALAIEQGSSEIVHFEVTDGVDPIPLLSPVLGQVITVHKPPKGILPKGITISPKLPFVLPGGVGDLTVSVDSTVTPGKYTFYLQAAVPLKRVPTGPIKTNVVAVEVEVLEKNWAQQFGSNKDDNATSVATDTSGNVYVAGVTEGTLPGQTNSGDGDAFISKYDPNGNELWTQQFGTSGWDEVNSVATDPSGNVYVAGVTGGTLPGQTNSGSRDVFVRKYDPNGNELWTQQFGTDDWDEANSVAVDPSGNVFVAGITDRTLPGQVNLGKDDVFIRKYDPNGNELWTQQFGSNETDMAASVATDASGNVYVAGNTEGALPGQVNLGSVDIFVRKYDSLGNELWTQQFGTTAADYANSVAADASGNVYIAGWTDGTLPGQTSLGYGDAFVRKYDSNGYELWTKQFGTGTYEAARSVTTDPSGNVYLAGTTWGTLPDQKSSGKDDAFIRKYDSDGYELWTKQFGTSSDDYANSVAINLSKNIYIAGWTSGTFPGEVNFGELDAFLYYKFVP